MTISRMKDEVVGFYLPLPPLPEAFPEPVPEDSEENPPPRYFPFNLYCNTAVLDIALLGHVLS